MPDEFWNSPLAWQIQRRRRWLHTLHFTVEQEPHRKGRSGKKSEAPFQNHVIAHLRSRSRHPFTGPVALDLRFVVNRKNPPAIYALAKSTLDMLGRVSSPLETRRQHVLYRDDRQVSLLYVHLTQGWEPEQEQQGERDNGRTDVTARPLRDVIEDLRLADKIRHSRDLYDSWEEEEYDNPDDNPFFVPDLPDEVDPEWTLTPRRIAVQPEYERITELLDSWSYYYKLRQMQEALLGRTDALLTSAICMRPERISGVRPDPEFAHPAFVQFREVEEPHWRRLLAEPLAIPLPDLPQAPGEGREFITELRSRLEAFRRRWRLYSPLLVPIKVTFFVIPPKQGKDLDNVALKALPIVHEVLRPHIRPSMLMPLIHDAEEIPSWRVDAMRRLKSLNAQSVVSYQVISLARTNSDPPSGMLCLVLGDCSIHRSLWDRVAHYVDDKLDLP